MDYREPAPRDASLSRAERRRLAAGKGDVAGKIGCKFCMSTVGTYIKHRNEFQCRTAGCKGNKYPMLSHAVIGSTGVKDDAVGPGTSHPFCTKEGEK